MYDIVHNGWTLNEAPITDMDVMDKLAKWQCLFKPLEVRESEIDHPGNLAQLKRNYRRRQRSLE